MQKLTNSVSRLAEIMATCERSLQIQQGAILKIIGHINGAEGIEGIDAPTEVN
jgi:hypothetical protein